MGKGDKKTRKGKITMGSFGKTRPHHVKSAPAAAAPKPEQETAVAPTSEKTKKPSA